MNTYPATPQIPASNTGDTNDMAIDLAAYYHMLREKAWIVITCALVAAALGGAYVLRTPKVYQSTAGVQVEQAEHKVVNIEDVSSEDLGSLELLRTIEQNLSNHTLMERVVSTMGLTATEVGLPPNPRVPYNVSDIADALGRNVSVKLVRNTRLIGVSAANTSPELAQRIASTIVEQYIESNQEYHVGVATDANKFLLQQADQLKAKLEQSEQQLQNYKEESQAVSLEGSQNITVEKLKDLNEKLTTAKADRLKLEADNSQVQKLAGQPPVNFLTIASVADSQAVLEAKKQMMEQESELANLKQRYLPKHPRYIQAEAALKALKDGLDSTIMGAAASVSTQYQAAAETENELSEALKEQEQMALHLNKIAIPYNVLERQVESDQALYDSVLSRLKETDVTKNLEEDNIRMVEQPVLPEKPLRPQPKLILAGSIMAGLVVGVLVCIGLNLLDNTFKTVDQAETQLELPAVAAVPKGKEGNSYESGFVIVNEPHGAIAESFRTLRTSLSLLGRESERKVFLFTSALPGEGKSFCSTNYAISLAHQGLKTLIIDADLRLPTIGKTFFKNAFHQGVAEVLTGNCTLEEAAQSSGVEGLHILTAGHRAPNPAELLAGQSFGDLVANARQKYDRVVIDSAPVNAVSDSLLLLKYVQSVCLVIHAGKTARRAVMRAVQRLTESGSRPVGFVLNRLPPHSGANYYYHYSAGEYGKGVYGAPAAEAQ